MKRKQIVKENNKKNFYIVILFFVVIVAYHFLLREYAGDFIKMFSPLMDKATLGEVLRKRYETWSSRVFIETPEYSCAVTPQVRQMGNRLSGLAGTAYASLLA